ncbi:uncharacterized protein LOC131079338 [Cryptomeria japonica]|uniref:uncharacterized protein LOC131079338 n=1 Tax=Cryptomeria japonica TaxID=3369 RepID=UPI0025AB6EAA|nr:uncharacterized protein LOC131079338 [Cryptomeria japonica]
MDWETFLLTINSSHSQVNLHSFSIQAMLLSVSLLFPNFDCQSQASSTFRQESFDCPTIYIFISIAIPLWMFSHLQAADYLYDGYWMKRSFMTQVPRSTYAHICMNKATTENWLSVYIT